MDFTFVPMNKTYATEIVNSWTYEGEHSVYNYALESDHMLDYEAWGRGLYAVLD